MSTQSTQSTQSFDIHDFSSFVINTVDTRCHNTYPCTHEVHIKLVKNGKSKKVHMNGELIAKYYNYNNINIPYHFNEYICNRSYLN